MNELTLEALAQRISALEQRMAMLAGVIPPTKDWRSAVGISEETEFSRAWMAEMKALKDAERLEASTGVEA